MRLLSAYLVTAIVLFFNNIGAENYTIKTNIPFKQVVIWGHKLHSHTHSYIHWGFYRAFQALGYPTYWLDNNDIINMDLSSTLFITEGQVDQLIPLRNDCWYILHNCDGGKYSSLGDKKRCITLQVYTHDCLPRNLTKIEECIYYNVKDRIIHMPWATDLLPHEIDTVKTTIPHRNVNNTDIYWIGSYGGGEFGNQNEINSFIHAAAISGIKFSHLVQKSMEENINLIQKSYMAPTIVGKWQCKQGYVPCRIFKNISYGQFGITNSETIYTLFNKKIVYNPDTYQLFYDAKEKIDNLDINELYELMDFVRDHHTYINRIQTLLTFFDGVFASHKPLEYARKATKSRHNNASKNKPITDHKYPKMRK